MIIEVGLFALIVIMVCIAILIVKFIYDNRWMWNAVEYYTEYTEEDLEDNDNKKEIAVENV